MKRWPKKALGEVAEFINGQAFKPSDWSSKGVPIIRIQNLTNPTASTNYFEGIIDKRHAITNGDLLVSWSATLDVFFWNKGDAVLNQHIFRVSPDASQVSKTYLFYALKSVMDELRSKTHGATMKHITKGPFEKTKIPVPPLAEQEQIVEVLDQADGLRKLRAQADNRTAALIPALFHEMFGDPASNPLQWDRCVLGDLIHAAQDGPHVSPKYAGTGVPFLSTRHIRQGRVIWEDLKFLSQADAEIHWRKCKPEKGDVLYTKGGTTGLAAAVTFDTPFAVWVHIALLKTNQAKADPVWLESMLNSSYCYRQSQELTHGIANRDLGLTRMVKIKMYLPPISLQQKFATRVADIRAIEFEQAASRQRLDDLFQSMLHRAFNGEL
jgi:type I restriction enzyme S subunit